jgi:hypothetical protein
MSRSPDTFVPYSILLDLAESEEWFSIEGLKDSYISRVGTWTCPTTNEWSAMIYTFNASNFVHKRFLVKQEYLETLAGGYRKVTSMYRWTV